MIRKGYHCAYDTHYHIVFPVKYRKALLSVEVTKALKEISKGFEERFELDIDQIGCDEKPYPHTCFISSKILDRSICEALQKVSPLDKSFEIS